MPCYDDAKRIYRVRFRSVDHHDTAGRADVPVLCGAVREQLEATRLHLSRRRRGRLVRHLLRTDDAHVRIYKRESDRAEFRRPLADVLHLGESAHVSVRQRLQMDATRLVKHLPLCDSSSGRKR
eukprot:scaffold363_cov255-Pinguiococcus_pyrenoidosus.AAC.9